MTAPVLAVAELSRLAAAMRSDWHPPAIDGAITAVQQAGWTPARIVTAFALAIADERATPRDLTEAARDPRRPGRARRTATDVQAKAAEARAALAAASTQQAAPGEQPDSEKEDLPW